MAPSRRRAVLEAAGAAGEGRSTIPVATAPRPGYPSGVILLVDNYDSFVHNLARYLRELGDEVVVRRNDRVGPDLVREMAPSHVVLSPGPCTPSEAGACPAIVRELTAEIPLLGVCLGHQCVGEVFGGVVSRAGRPMHGKLSAVRHRGTGLFAGLPSPLRVTRYHSLVVEADGLPDELEMTAWTEEGEVMALRHRERPAWGVQFHPEGVLTEAGHALLANFLALGRGLEPDGSVPEGIAAEVEPARLEPAGVGPGAAASAGTGAGAPGTAGAAKAP